MTTSTIKPSQGGEPVKGLTKQHFAAIAFVCAQAVNEWDKRRKEDDLEAEAVAFDFVELCLLPGFDGIFEDANKGFDHHAFRELFHNELRHVQHDIAKRIGCTDEEIAMMDDAAAELASGLCDAVEAVSGKTIDESIADDTLAEDVETTADLVKEGFKERTDPLMPSETKEELVEILKDASTYVLDADHAEYLNDLREEGSVNMFGATPYLMAEFDLSRKQAQAALSAWMLTFGK